MYVNYDVKIDFEIPSITLVECQVELTHFFIEI